ncbi:MAG: hypothetical protein PF495_01675 [Spirochaetales bacterium]|jgi:hypothetical protein|nr:hypothetical protein [Spirochaetales bacterium]
MNIDRELAEKVMGWELLKVGHFGTEYETPRQAGLEAWMNNCGLDSVGEYFIDEVRGFWIPVESWHPFTDIGQAFQVEKKMRKKHDFWLSLSYKTERRLDGKESHPEWWARFRCVRGATRPDGYAHYDTLSEAICVAARMAVGTGRMTHKTEGL